MPSIQTVVVKPEQIRLVRRDDSKKWQARYKLENLKTWFRRSTDTANVKMGYQDSRAPVDEGHLRLRGGLPCEL